MDLELIASFWRDAYSTDAKINPVRFRETAEKYTNTYGLEIVELIRILTLRKVQEASEN